MGKGDLTSVPFRCSGRTDPGQLGEAERAADVVCGRSRTLYHRPLQFFRNQARGTSPSRIETASARPPWRWMVCSVAQKDLAGPCSQTTDQQPRL
jgi:hypothetical protein